MIKIGKIESKFFELLEDKITAKEFEHWVFQSQWLEDELSEEEYADLIGLDYGLANVTGELRKILDARFGQGKLESIKLIRRLDSIIKRDEKEAESLMMMYELYCHDYFFLKDLGLGVGLFVEIPDGYGVESFDELTEEQQQNLLDGVHPVARELAEGLKQSILKGDLQINGEKEYEMTKELYVDNRTEEEKESKIWEAVDFDEQTGEPMAERHRLLDKYGNFPPKKMP
ncbi:MAG: hypothetical protein AAFV95_20785 [Bacteroidota bacterium]